MKVKNIWNETNMPVAQTMGRVRPSICTQTKVPNLSCSSFSSSSSLINLSPPVALSSVKDEESCSNTNQWLRSNSRLLLARKLSFEWRNQRCHCKMQAALVRIRTSARKLWWSYWDGILVILNSEASNWRPFKLFYQVQLHTYTHTQFTYIFFMP